MHESLEDIKGDVGFSGDQRIEHRDTLAEVCSRLGQP